MVKVRGDKCVVRSAEVWIWVRVRVRVRVRVKA